MRMLVFLLLVVLTTGSDGAFAQNMSVVVDPWTGEGQPVEMYELGTPAPVTAPMHDSHTLNVHELVSGRLMIRSDTIRGLRGGIKGYGVYFNP